MRALAHPAWFRPTPRRGAGRGRADPPPSTRAPPRPTQRRGASGGGFFGDLDVLPAPSPSAPPPTPSSSSSLSPPHVIDRPPPGVHDYYPPPPGPHDEAASPFGSLQPRHGAAHTHASTHARRARTIRVVLPRPIDEHISIAPRFSPAPHCAIQELAVRARSPRAPPRRKATTRAPRKEPCRIRRFLATFIFNLDIPPRYLPRRTQRTSPAPRSVRW